MIEIKEVDIKEAIKVHKNIKEFNETKPEKEYFENRYRDREKLIIVAYYNNVPAGYIIGYDKFQDGKNFYCWMAGVDSKFRKLGILTKMMQYQENWAKQKGYSILKIKTCHTIKQKYRKNLLMNDRNMIQELKFICRVSLRRCHKLYIFFDYKEIFICTLFAVYLQVI